MTRKHVTAALLLTGLVLVLAGCGGSDDGETTEAAATTATTTTTTAATTTRPATTRPASTTQPATTTKPETTTKPATTTTREPKATTIRIDVVGGKPAGGIARPSVKKGDHVVLVVTSDTADEVHLHG